MISGDPSADNTDLYAFVSPDDPTKLTIVANYIPLQQPGGGPNFHPFDQSVRYRIHIDNTGDGRDDVTYTIRFKDHAKSGKDGVSSFLYNNGPVDLGHGRDLAGAAGLQGRAHEERRHEDPGFQPSNRAGQHRPALHARTTPRWPRRASTACPTAARSTPARATTRSSSTSGRSSTSAASVRSTRSMSSRWPTEAGVDGVAGYNTASIVLQVPISEVRRSSSTAGHRRVGQRGSPRAQARSATSGKVKWSGDWVQVSRLGNPLINEVIIPRHLKDYWNGQHPSKDSQFQKYYEAPELAGLINFLYPALADVDTTGRTDLSLILLKGVPGVNAIGANPVAADMLRVNTAILPGAKGPCPGGTASAAQPRSTRPVLAADLCGFPNGRRLVDDVTDIELRAIAQGYGTFLNGAFGLPNKSPNNQVGDGVDSNADMPFLGAFPYIGLPHSGYESVPPLKAMLP